VYVVLVARCLLDQVEAVQERRTRRRRRQPQSRRIESPYDIGQGPQDRSVVERFALAGLQFVATAPDREGRVVPQPRHDLFRLRTHHRDEVLVVGGRGRDPRARLGELLPHQQAPPVAFGVELRCLDQPATPDTQQIHTRIDREVQQPPEPVGSRHAVAEVERHPVPALGEDPPPVHLDAVRRRVAGRALRLDEPQRAEPNLVLAPVAHHAVGVRGRGQAIEVRRTAPVRPPRLGILHRQHPVPGRDHGPVGIRQRELHAIVA
jgi:hypothetical protein